MNQLIRPVQRHVSYYTYMLYSYYNSIFLISMCKLFPSITSLLPHSLTVPYLHGHANGSNRGHCEEREEEAILGPRYQRKLRTASLNCVSLLLCGLSSISLVIISVHIMLSCKMTQSCYYTYHESTNNS